FHPHDRGDRIWRLRRRCGFVSGDQEALRSRHLAPVAEPQAAWRIRLAEARECSIEAHQLFVASSVRLRAPKCEKSAARWILTVPSAISSSRAISLFDKPRRTQARTSRCRGEIGFTGRPSPGSADATGGSGFAGLPGVPGIAAVMKRGT